MSEKEFVELSVLSFSDVELRVDFRFVEFPFDFPEHYKTNETHNSMRRSRKHCIVEFLVELLLSFQNRRSNLRAHTHTHTHTYASASASGWVDGVGGLGEVVVMVVVGW